MRKARNIAIFSLSMLSLILTLAILRAVFNSNERLDIQWSEKGDWIVFACGDFPLSSPKSHLYIIRNNGNQLQRITTSDFIATNPSWSSDGDWIAFISENTLYKIQPNGTGLEEIVNLSALDTLQSVDWSPSDDWIVFSSHSVTDGAIHRIRSDGEEHSVILQGDNLYTSLAWSPDGNLIAYTIPPLDQSSGVYLIDKDGKNTKTFDNVETLGQIDWSPDGTELLFTSFSNQNQLYSLSIKDGQLRPIKVSFFTNAPVWSPDGERLAFVGAREDGGDWLQLYTASLDGGEVNRLTDMRDCNVTNPQWYSFNMANS